MMPGKSPCNLVKGSTFSQSSLFSFLGDVGRERRGFFWLPLENHEQLSELYTHSLISCAFRKNTILLEIALYAPRRLGSGSPTWGVINWLLKRQKFLSQLSAFPNPLHGHFQTLQGSQSNGKFHFYFKEEE